MPNELSNKMNAHPNIATLKVGCQALGPARAFMRAATGVKSGYSLRDAMILCGAVLLLHTTLSEPGKTHTTTAFTFPGASNDAAIWGQKFLRAAGLERPTKDIYVDCGGSHFIIRADSPAGKETLKELLEYLEETFPDLVTPAPKLALKAAVEAFTSRPPAHVHKTAYIAAMSGLVENFPDFPIDMVVKLDEALSGLAERLKERSGMGLSGIESAINGAYVAADAGIQKNILKTLFSVYLRVLQS